MDLPPEPALGAQDRNHGFDGLRHVLGAPVPDQLLLLACTHPSAVGEGHARTRGSNQRLEFLGDALVGAVVAEHLYREAPGSAEGVLTSRKIASVRRDALAAAARRLEWQQHLRLSRGELLAGGRDRESNLADLFEALVGALFISQGWEAARSFVVRALEMELRAGAHGVAPAKNRWQEYTQALRLGTPWYRTEAGAQGRGGFAAEVLLGESVLGSGWGRTKKGAEEAAAEAALAACAQSAAVTPEAGPHDASVPKP